MKFDCKISDHQSVADCLQLLKADTAEDCDKECLFGRIRLGILSAPTDDAWTIDSFRTDVEANLDNLVRWLTGADLIEIVRVFMLRGNPVERRNAAITIVIRDWDLCVRSERALSKTPIYPSDLTAFENPIPLWDGIVTVIIRRDEDMVFNAFSRVGRLLAETPTLRLLHDAVMKSLFLDADFVLARLAQRHPRNIVVDACRPPSESELQVITELHADVAEQRSYIQGLKIGVAFWMTNSGQYREKFETSSKNCEMAWQQGEEARAKFQQVRAQYEQTLEQTRFQLEQTNTQLTHLSTLYELAHGQLEQAHSLHELNRIQLEQSQREREDMRTRYEAQLEHSRELTKFWKNECSTHHKQLHKIKRLTVAGILYRVLGFVRRRVRPK